MSKLDDIKKKSEEEHIISDKVKEVKVIAEVKEEYVEEYHNNDESSYMLGFISYATNHISSQDMKFMDLLLGCAAFGYIVRDKISGINYNPFKELHISKINTKTQNNYYFLSSSKYLTVIYSALTSHYSKITENIAPKSKSKLFIDDVINGKRILIISDIIESVETFGYRFTDIVLTIIKLGYDIDLDVYDEIHVVDINNIRYSVIVYDRINDVEFIEINSHSTSAEVDLSNSQIDINMQTHCADCILNYICKDNSTLKIK